MSEADRTKANKVLGGLKEAWPLMTFLTPRVTAALLNGRAGTREGVLFLDKIQGKEGGKYN